ncbi:diaminopimelate decarboxylase [Desulforhabdus amnigena]|jgi:diaminopimelate decarboxylase|uniref:Diaminopimelate decarboxylase n=1 Tax=Desulforhabdus amnigena TaxID=40218 RepID=A0A9W6D3F7_9BACT|nr:diaminopimelate decarboxylase [Desulforhabdus amnigena]NLJ29785.1 diaminopimelate decarboxylase [Deltaproteobacteria bacterium]GLI33492.1 diaminopimelate decarboxylase [Desulforhabdus amnigena]
MHHFFYKNEELYCENIPLKKLAAEVGTPCYVYSHSTLQHHFNVFDGAFANVSHLTCYSVKANSNLSILRLFGSMGGGVDIVSGGELFRARKAGIPPERIVYSGVGKTVEEIDFALKEGILMFNIESTEELDAINSRAGILGCRARIALRVNPDVDPKTHPYISTGMKKSKFGIDVESALQAYEQAKNLDNIEILGVDCHIGSQLTEISPFVDALKRLRLLLDRLDAMGVSIRYLDLGGGLGIPYDQEAPPHPTDYAQAILQELKGLSCTLIFEPGRVIVGNAGILLTRVLYTKKTESKNFVIVDAGMNDLIRPSLYGSYHQIQPLQRKSTETQIVDVVGPICESGDFLARDRTLPVVASGDHLAVMSAGAYGFTMSSNYNSRPRAAEVLVKGDRYYIIRQRETWEDMVRLEEVAEFSQD